MEGKKNYGWSFVLLGFIGVAVFFIIPFFLSLYYSFTKGVSTVYFVGLENFRDLLVNPAFRLAASNSLKLIGIGVPVITMASLFLAVLMSDTLYKFPRWAMLSPMMVPVASALIGWQLIFGDMGISNKLLNLVGASSVSFFSEANAMKFLTGIFIIKNTGYMLVIFTGAIASLKKEYKEAFLLDSNSKLKYTLKIVIPLIGPIIFFVVLLSIVNSFQMFREVYGLYGNNPPNSVYLLQHFMNNNFHKLNYQRLSTAAFILVMAISLLISLYLRYQNKQKY